MEEKIKNILEEAIQGRVFPGATVGILHKDLSRKFVSAGRFEYDSSSPPVLDSTIYDTASITKSIPIALTALMFIEKGLLSLEDRIIKYIPEIIIENAEKALIRHLLTYTYVLKKNSDPNFSYEHSKAEDIFGFLFKREFEFLPGTRYQYSNTPLNLLGIILERISGEKLYSLAGKIVFGPLEMKTSTFLIKDKQKIPPTEIVSWRGKIQGVVHDETAYILGKEGFNPGCAGLFSTTEDILNVAEMILNNGSFRGIKIFGSKTIGLMKANALGDIGEWCGIGWELNQLRFMGDYSHEQMIGKTGFTGTCCIIDPKQSKALVILSNRTYPKRPINGDAINEIRRSISNVVFKS
ncbi:MAG: serine hydrolase domain-containing protein [Candidatus Paceibacterota bacterium]|jgi:CubicO group peptidase (beta-lactamase class C family)